MTKNKKVVITGMGVVSPIGIGITEFWDALVQRKSGVRLREGFEERDWPLKLYAPVVGFDGKQWVKPRKSMKVMCLPIQFGYTAATMALEQSGLAEFEMDPNRMGTVFGSETFFADPLEVADVFRKCVQKQNYEHDRWGEFAMRNIQPLWMLKYLPNMVTSHISIAADARGPSNSICQGDVSSLLALIEGVDLIRRGSCDVVIVGGTGCQTSLSGTLYRGQEEMSRRVDDPENAVRPFDADRDGRVYGEGAGAMIIESEDFARARDAEILGNVDSYSRAFCPQIASGDDSDAVSDSIAATIQTAMERSNSKSKDFSHINSHGCSEIQSDIHEAKALRQCFSDVPVVAYKSNLGHLGPGSPIIELIGSILSAKQGKVIPGRNYDHADPNCPINVAQEVADFDANQSKILKLAYAQTGQIASVVISCDS